MPDPPNHRVFIARQDRVMVVDEDKGTLPGEVTGMNGDHGTAIAAAPIRMDVSGFIDMDSPQRL